MAFPVFEKKEDIPKGFEEDYEEREGKFHPKIPDVAKQQTALEAERKRADDEKKARATAENALAELRRKEAARDGNVSEDTLKKLRDEDEKKRREELDPVLQERDRLKAENTKIKKTDRVQKMFLDSGGMPDRLEDAMLALDRRTGLTEDGNTITVLDKDGKLTTMKVEDFIKVEFKKEKPWLYAGSGASGSGAGGSNGSGGAPDGEEQAGIAAKKRAQVQGAF